MFPCSLLFDHHFPCTSLIVLYLQGVWRSTQGVLVFFSFWEYSITTESIGIGQELQAIRCMADLIQANIVHEQILSVLDLLIYADCFELRPLIRKCWCT